MIKCTKPVGIAGVHYSTGDTYSGPDEKLLVSINKAVYMDAPAVEQSLELEPMSDTAPEPVPEPVPEPKPKKKRGRRKKADKQ